MFYKIFRYELRYQFRLASTHIYFGIMFALAFLATLGAGGTFTGVSVHFSNSSDRVMINSPYYLHSVITAFGYIGIIFVAAIAARSINRDYENGTHQWFYTLPLKKGGFILGRLAGSFSVLVYIMSASLLGTYLAAVCPWVDPLKFAPNSFINYIYPFLTSTLPYLAFALTLMTAVSLWFRSTLNLMITAIMLIMTYAIMTEIKVPLEYKYLVALIDPFGMFTLDHVSKYWTIAEQNTKLIPFSGIFLYNRILYSSLAVICFLAAYRKFSFSVMTVSSKKTAQSDIKAVPASPVPTPVIKKGFRAELAKYFSLTYDNFIHIIKSGPFIGLYAFWFVQTLINAKWMGEMYETTVLPVTSLVMKNLYGNSVVFILAVITIYSGEVIWRERDRKYDGIINSYPVSTLTLFLSKLSSLVLMIYFFLASNIAFGIIIQTLKGYFNYELGVYFSYFFIYSAAFLVLLTFLSFFIHVLANHKYIGYMLVILYYLVQMFMGAFDLHHPLYTFGSFDNTYSDINGFGYTGKFFVMTIYYFSFTAILLIFAKMMWVRDAGTGFRSRMLSLKQNFSPSAAAGFAGSFAVFAFFGIYIFYNTNILDEYRTNADDEIASVNYEKDYKRFERIPQPQVCDVKVKVDIFPSERSVQVEGAYILKNNNTEEIREIHVLSEKRVPRRFSFSVPASLSDSCAYIPYYIYALADPLLPGDSLRMDFYMDHSARGFSGGGAIYNGTFINNFSYFPIIGYSSDLELADEYKRKKQGLPDKERMASMNDEYEVNRNYVGNASWTKLEAVVSTSSDQTATAPGRLVEKWTENGRNYFKYRSDRKILNFFSFNSARYDVKRTEWNGIGLEVYYHPGHAYNVDHILEMMKLSLMTFAESFGPFQFPVLRIVEFPLGGFAQSFATTIPFSENLGFIIDMKGKSEKGVDYLADITAHEIGHQWWAHQVISANTRGATLLTEVPAQYSSYLVLKRISSAKEIRTYLKYALDSYLSGRKTESRKELSLTQNENQGYLHYYKGIMAMAALDDYISTDSLSAALKRFVRDKSYASGPYPVSIELIPYLISVTPDSLRYLVNDMFEDIIVYDNKALSAECRKNGDGKYLTRLTVSSEKFRVDSLGNESKIPKKDYFSIGLLDKDDEPIYMKKYLIDTDSATFEMMTDQKPEKAGIDPSVLLIDRKRDDNTIGVKFLTD